MNYYNDFEPFAAKWLTELMTDGLIPEGHVDDKSILEIQPDQLDYDQCHFFAGIGGWPRALQLAGWDADEPVWTASLPCQPFSCAGQQGGEQDERHLWPVFFSLVKECRPPIIFGEQVASKDGREWLAGIQTDLETLGYSTAAADLPAASVGAPHKRNRLFWCAVGNTSNERLQGRKRCDAVQGKDSERRTGIHGAITESSSPTGRVADSDGSRPEDKHEINLRGEFSKRHGAMGFWSNSILIPCADGKYRRVPGRRSNPVRKMRRNIQGNGHAMPEMQEDNGRCGVERVENPSGTGTGDNGGEIGGQGWESLDTGKEGIRQAHGQISADGFDADGSEGKRVADTKLYGHPATEEGRCFREESQKGRVCEFTRTRCEDSTKHHLEIEPALFPLSDGLPNRVGLLRGAGNSIVPQVAAEFVKAVMEISCQVI